MNYSGEGVIGAVISVEEYVLQGRPVGVCSFPYLLINYSFGFHSGSPSAL